MLSGPSLGSTGLPWARRVAELGAAAQSRIQGLETGTLYPVQAVPDAPPPILTPCLITSPCPLQSIRAGPDVLTWESFRRHFDIGLHDHQARQNLASTWVLGIEHRPAVVR